MPFAKSYKISNLPGYTKAQTVRTRLRATNFIGVTKYDS